jgi:drug/metabolite transporter (DMT)-like permease
VLAAWRAFFAFLVLLLILLLFKRSLLKVARSNRFFLVLFGLAVALFNSSWTLSVAYNGAAVATVLAYCSAGFTVFLGWWFLGESLNWGKLLAALVSLSGCLLVSGALASSTWHFNLAGIITGLLSGLLYAIYTLLGRSASKRGISPFTSLLYAFGLAALFISLFNLLFAGRLPGTIEHLQDFLWLGRAWVGWGVLFLLAAGPTLVGFILYNTSLIYLPSSITNLVLTSEPVFSIILAFFLLSERLTHMQVLGSLLIIGGVIFLRIYEGRRSDRPGGEADLPVE